MKEITRIVAKEFNVDYHTLFTKTRERKFVEARQSAMFMIKEKHPLSTLHEIGDFFNRDHSTVLHAYKTVKDLIETNKVFSRKIAIARHKCDNIKPVKIVYIAHPISGDVDGNVKKILEIVKSINFLNPFVIPFAPYISDVLALDDSIQEQREKGIANNIYILESGIVNELWVYGDNITKGIKKEIEIATANNIEVVFKS